MCALLSGGGYAEKVAVPAGQVLPVPRGISLIEAASFLEVACTVWSTAFMMSRLSAGETFLVNPFCYNSLSQDSLFVFHPLVLRESQGGYDCYCDCLKKSQFFFL